MRLGTALCAIPICGFVAQPFYQGRELKGLVGSGVGGGADAYARLLGSYWSKIIPGNPSIVRQNLPPSFMPSLDGCQAAEPRSRTT